MRLLYLTALLPVLAGAQDAREIVRRSVENDLKNEQAARSYTYLERQEERRLDGDGRVKSKESRTWDVTLLEQSPYRRLVARNDQPLPPKEQEKEEEKLRKSIDERRKETPEQRERRRGEWERRRQKQREPVTEMLDAFDFRLVREEPVDGFQAWVVDCMPKPGYKPKRSSASYLPKIKARLWIHRDDYQWIKVEAETLDTISFGGILFRLSKGGRVMLEQVRINNEVWLPRIITIQATGRIALVKGIRADVEIRYSNFKKFQVDSRVVDTQVLQ